MACTRARLTLTALFLALAAVGCANLATQKSANQPAPFPQPEGGPPVAPIAGGEASLADVQRADTAYAKQNWREAEGIYQRLTTAVPNDPYPWFRLGNVYAKTDRWDFARSAYREALKRNADHHKALHNFALVNLMQAKEMLQAGLSRFKPDDPSVTESRTLLADLDRLIGATGTMVAQAKQPAASRSQSAEPKPARAAPEQAAAEQPDNGVAQAQPTSAKQSPVAEKNPEVSSEKRPSAESGPQTQPAPAAKQPSEPSSGTESVAAATTSARPAIEPAASAATREPTSAAVTENAAASTQTLTASTETPVAAAETAKPATAGKKRAVSQQAKTSAPAQEVKRTNRLPTQMANNTKPTKPSAREVTKTGNAVDSSPDRRNAHLATDALTSNGILGRAVYVVKRDK
jgi:tetratricopeptide (TPR) repeat protein